MNSTQDLLFFDLAPEVEAFSTRRDCILPYPVIQAHQTHSINVAVIDHPGYTREELEGVDALVTDVPGVAIGVRTADCIPVLMYDPIHKAVAAVHSGWRGTVNKISTWAISAMIRNYGTKPGDLRVAIGPGIGPDAFQVGEEVVQFFKDSGFPLDRVWSFRGPRVSGNLEGGHHLDLKEAVKFTLVEASVPEENIIVSPICTYYSPEFFSARREGSDCGRIINSIMLK